MGAGTSGLQSDLETLEGEVKDIERAFTVTRDNYKQFPSSAGVTLRREVDAHLLRNSADQGIHAAVQGFRNKYRQFPSASRLTLRTDVDNLKTDAAYLTNIVLPIKQEFAGLKLDTANLTKDLRLLQRGYNAMVEGGCATISCQIDGSYYATSSDMLDLQASVGQKATKRAAVNLDDKLLKLEGPTANAVDVNLVNSKADQADVNDLSKLVGLAAGTGSGPATGLFLQLADRTTRAEVNGLALAIGTGATGSAIASGLYLRMDSASANSHGLATSIGTGAAGGVGATGLFKKAEDTSAALGTLATLVGNNTDATGLIKTMQGKADQAQFATLSSTVGNAGSRLVGKVAALQARPSEAPGQAVGAVGIDNGRSTYRIAGAAMAWSACYPNVNGKLVDFIQHDCTARGNGWSHKGRYSNSGGVVTCFKQGGVEYKAGVCHTTPEWMAHDGW